MISIAQPFIGQEEQDAVKEVLKSGQITSGVWTKRFEEEFAAYQQAEHAVAVTNGTEALHLMMLAAGIGEGDEVITTSFTFIASANAIVMCGARPVFVDIDEHTFNLDPELIEAAITPKTKAILPVHIYGLPANLDKIMTIAQKHNLLVFEDAAQAHGAAIKQKRVGAIGLAGSFSFYPTKNMTTSEGGAVVTNDGELADKMKLYREQGMKVRYHHEVIGYNYRMTNISAAIGIEQLKRLPEFTKKRQRNAQQLTKSLSKIKGIITPTTPDEYEHVFHQYVIKVTPEFGKSRDELIKYLADNEIGSMIYYPIPVHQQKPYREMGIKVSLPITERLSQEVLALPVHPQLSEQDITTIIQTIERI